jgi:hypothetical protein
MMVMFIMLMAIIMDDEVDCLDDDYDYYGR